jgi:hypothetical protein
MKLVFLRRATGGCELGHRSHGAREYLSCRIPRPSNHKIDVTSDQLNYACYRRVSLVVKCGPSGSMRFSIAIILMP